MTIDPSSRFRAASFGAITPSSFERPFIQRGPTRVENRSLASIILQWNKFPQKALASTFGKEGPQGARTCFILLGLHGSATKFGVVGIVSARLEAQSRLCLNTMSGK